MNRVQTRIFLASLITMFASGGGCGADRGPTEPSTPTGPTDTYTISGTINEFRGGPISGVGVRAFSYRDSAHTVTDAQGRYSLSSQFTGDVGLVVWKTGYMDAWKYNMSAPESTVDFALHPSVEVSPAGEMLAATIRGDEYMAGDDVLFGGLCSHAPCKIVQFKGYSGAPPRVEVRLRWDDPARQLALYAAAADLEEIPPPVFPYFAVAFEQAAGERPGPADSQPFELMVRQIR